MRVLVHVLYLLLVFLGGLLSTKDAEGGHGWSLQAEGRDGGCEQVTTTHSLQATKELRVYVGFEVSGGWVGGCGCVGEWWLGG